MRMTLRRVDTVTAPDRQAVAAPLRVNASVRQRGSALVMGLVFLVILTLLGLSASGGSIQQELISRNLRDQSLALESADAALRAGETWLRTRGGPLPIALDPAFGNAFVKPAGYCDAVNSNCPYAGAGFWGNAANAEPLGGAQDGQPILPTLPTANQPRYIVEYLYKCETCGGLGQSGQSNPRYYRITARGVGLSVNTERVVQSIYRYH